jgi:ATP-dependent DNA ligase
VLPKIEPILPVLSNTVPTGKEWLYQPKLDGFRGVFFLESGAAFFMSKTKKPMPRFRELAATQNGRSLADSMSRYLNSRNSSLGGTPNALASG